MYAFTQYVISVIQQLTGAYVLQEYLCSNYYINCPEKTNLYFASYDDSTTLKILNAVSYDDNTEIKTGPGWLNELSSWIT